MLNKSKENGIFFNWTKRDHILSHKFNQIQYAHLLAVTNTNTKESQEDMTLTIQYQTSEWTEILPVH
jgi:hypothetical protein